MEENVTLLPTARKDFSKIGLSLFVLGIVAILSQFAFAFLWQGLCTLIPSLSNASWGMWVVSFVPMYLIAMPVCILMMRRVPAETMPEKKLGGKNFFLLMLMCLPLMYGGNIIGTVLAMLFSGGTAENALLNYIFDDPLIVTLVVVGIAPVLEEYIFRKQIIDRCGKYGEKTAILLSAVTFSLFHMNLFQMVYAFALGMLFAFVYTRTRRLRYSVIMHMIINFMGSVLAPWLLTLLDMEVLNEMAMGNVDMAAITEMLPGLILYYGYSFLLMGGSVAGLVLLIVMRKKFFLLPASQELPKEQRCRTAYLNVGMILFVVFCLIMTVYTLFAV